MVTRSAVMESECERCGKPTTKHSKLCSECWHLSRRGISLTTETKEKIRLSHLGLHPSEETRRKMGLARANVLYSLETCQKISASHLAEKNPMWKGDNVGYGALHGWMRNHKPKPNLCENCHLNEPYDLANISQKYKRELDDWEWLCRGCHMDKDGRMDNLIQFNKEG